MSTVLALEDVRTSYGSIEALKGISLEVRDGEIVTLLGANGAGKSTTLRSINGLNRPRQGYIKFLGRDITSTPRSEEHTSELQSRLHLVCRLLLEKKKNTTS